MNISWIWKTDQSCESKKEKLIFSRFKGARDVWTLLKRLQKIVDVPKTTLCSPKMLNFLSKKLGSKLSSFWKSETDHQTFGMAPFDFVELPNDLKVEIFGWLDLDDIKVAERVCREWRNLSENEAVWKKIYDRDFGQKEGTWESEDAKLFWFVKNNYPHCVNIVLKENKDKNPGLIESEKDAGFSPLYRACQKGHLEVVKVLISHGANIESKKGDGSSCLYISSQENRLEVVKYLLEQGADIEATFRAGFTSLYIAAQKGHLEIVRCLIEHGAKMDAAAEKGATPIYIACQNGHKDVVEYLISKMANIEVQFKDGFTPLFIACQKGHREVVELLINSGANIEVRGGDSTPIYVAAQNGHYEIVDLLIKKGAEINSKFKSHYSPLYIAAQKGHLQILKLLLQYGADLEQACARGSTPLFVASQNGHYEIVKELIKRGVNPETVFDNGHRKRRAIDIARENGHKQIEKLLAKYMEKYSAGAVSANGETKTVKDSGQVYKK